MFGFKRKFACVPKQAVLEHFTYSKQFVEKGDRKLYSLHSKFKKIMI